MKLTAKYLFILIFSVNCLKVFAQDVGTAAPDFSAKDMSGRTLSLIDFKGKVIILDFWASWCIPCKKSIPFLSDIYEQNTDTNLAVIGINVDTDPKNIKEFENQINLEIPFPVINDKNLKLPPVYDVEGMPSTFVIDKRGIIKYKETGFTNEMKEQLSNLILKLIKE